MRISFANQSVPSSSGSQSFGGPVRRPLRSSGGYRQLSGGRGGRGGVRRRQNNNRPKPTEADLDADMDSYMAAPVQPILNVASSFSMLIFNVICSLGGGYKNAVERIGCFDMCFLQHVKVPLPLHLLLHLICFIKMIWYHITLIRAILMVRLNMLSEKPSNTWRPSTKMSVSIFRVYPKILPSLFLFFLSASQVNRFLSFSRAAIPWLPLSPLTRPQLHEQRRDSQTHSGYGRACRWHKRVS